MFSEAEASKDAYPNFLVPRKDHRDTSSVYVLGMRVDALATSDSVAAIAKWSSGRQGRYVCLANVHMAVETCRSETYRAVVNGADLVLSDGRPLLWAAKLLGARSPSQTRGADLLPALCEMAETQGLSVAFIGGTSEVLRKLIGEVERRYPRLRICYHYSPPFRALTPQEEGETVRAINAAGPALLFVGLGCPRQEAWMARHKGAISATMLGVGAAFDFIAGSRPQAPRWMQRCGLEWAFRLAQEPRRLFWRYAYTNSYFLIMLMAQIISRRAPRRTLPSRREDRS